MHRYEKTDGMKEMDNASPGQRERIEKAEHRMEHSRQKFSRLHAVCVAGEQGLRSVLDRLMVALGEAPPESLRPVFAKVRGGVWGGGGGGC
jgi:uncharacterized protein with von Willebrand factor type A (vWA) domain